MFLSIIMPAQRLRKMIRARPPRAKAVSHGGAFQSPNNLSLGRPLARMLALRCRLEATRTRGQCPAGPATYKVLVNSSPLSMVARPHDVA